MTNFSSQTQRLLFSLFAILLLSSCDPFTSPQSLMDEYPIRLARVLDVATKNGPQAPSAIWPRVRERRVTIPEIEINMLAFLDLYGCDLQVVVGERNAILGKVMQPLNRLRYSQRFIKEAGICIDSIDDASLKQTLKEASILKRQQLPAEIWQASWASDEMAGLLSHTAQPMSVELPLANSQQLAEDFVYLNQTVDALLSGSNETALIRWGKIQQRWQYQDGLGALIKSAQQLTLMLNAGSAILKQRIDEKPLCYQGKPNPRARQLEGVFFNVYIGHVQPYIALISQHRDVLLPAAREFAAQQADTAPASVKTYWQQYLLDEPQSIWPAFDLAVKNHTQYWQNLLEQCGLKPKAARPDKAQQRQN
ncbi:MAG TPA: DUF3080 family protein [Methylotenera sp.]|nr:DUF3080 family protein [Methylotenera sp.]